MDDAFASLEDINDEQTLERLESFFDSSSSVEFATYGSSILNVVNNDGSQQVPPSSQVGIGSLGTDFSINTNVPTRGISMAASQSSSMPTVLSSTSAVLSNDSRLPPNPSLISNTKPQIIQLQSSVQSNIFTLPVGHPTPGGLTVMASQPVCLTTQPSKTSTIKPQIMLSNGIIAGQAPTQQIFQIPMATNYSSGNSLSRPSPILGSAPVMLNQGAQVSPFARPPLIINNLGQVINTSPVVGSVPLLIQQPPGAAGGGSVFMLKQPTGGQATLLPIQTPGAISTSMGGNTFIIQQAANPVQPQIKLITPQGRMQMQQVHTSTGVKLVAVPVANVSQPTNTIFLQAAPPSQVPAKKNCDVESEEPRPKVLLDLGELMKDVGLDLEGGTFGIDEAPAPASLLPTTESNLRVQSTESSQVYNCSVTQVQGTNHAVSSCEMSSSVTASSNNNRVPMYEDDRLPKGWHRMVSQRKSGSKAGRFETFIIGPSSKRFRSKNQLKAYFERTGEANLNAEDFDFSTFGNGSATIPSNKEASNNAEPNGSNFISSQASSYVKLGDASSSNPITLPNAHGITTNVLPVSISSVLDSCSTINEDEEAQVSQLLETLQTNPQKLEIEGEKMVELLESLSSSSSNSATIVESSSSNDVSQHVTMAGQRGLPDLHSQLSPVQNLPPHTRFVRDAKGQLTMQKVHTIELSMELQQSLRVVQKRIKELEEILRSGKSLSKNQSDVSELMLLQTKQQQIFDMGKPVTVPTIAAAASAAAAAGAALTTSDHNSIRQPLVSMVVSNSGMTSISVSVNNCSAPNVIIPPATSMLLSDAQKRLVNDFKHKMSLLPAHAQAAFVTQHKADLINRLNLIHSSNQVQSQPIRPGLPNRQLQRGFSMLKNEPLNNATAPTSSLSSMRQNEALLQKRNKKIAWIESQIRKDQQGAVEPNYSTPFRGKEDACKRLLRYHVFHELETIEDDEQAFENRSQILLNKYRSMLDKYHLLMIRDSMRSTVSSENVMVARMWMADERESLQQEKEALIVLSPPSSVVSELPPIIKTDDKPQEVQFDDEFLAIKNELNRYNMVNGTYNMEGGGPSDVLFLQPPEKIIPEVLNDEVDPEGFSFGDVILENNDRCNNSQDDEYGMNDESRLDTPDFNKIASLMDTIEYTNNEDRDLVTENAVNNIPQF